MELGRVPNVGIELTVELVLVLFLDDVVEGDVGEIADRGCAAEAGMAADGGTVCVNREAHGGARAARAVLD